MTDSGAPLLVVDANNLLVRSLKAAERSVDLSTADGTPTGALVLFINMLSRYVRMVNPSRLALCWDGGRSVHRLGIYGGYKGDRPQREGDADETVLFATAQEFVTLAGLHQIQWQGYEADDLIAGFWLLALPDPLVILSGDKDLLQLVDPPGYQIRPGLKTEVWHFDTVTDELGCTPEQWADVLTLSGDVGDGVPGVPRVGVKTACKDLAAVDWDLDRLVVEGPERYRLHQSDIERNAKLVNLRRHAPPGLERLQPPPRFSPTVPSSMAWTALMDFFDRYELVAIKAKAANGGLWPSL